MSALGIGRVPPPFDKHHCRAAALKSPCLVSQHSNPKRERGASLTLRVRVSRSCTLILVVPLMLSVLSPPVRANEADLIARLQREIPEKWNAVVLPNVLKYQWSYVLTEKNNLKNGEISQKVHGEVKFSPKFCMLHRMRFEIPPTGWGQDLGITPNSEWVYGYNTKYSFKITNRAGESTWGIKELAFPQPESPPWTFRQYGGITQAEMSPVVQHFRHGGSIFPVARLLTGIPLGTPPTGDRRLTVRLSAAREQPGSPSLVRVELLYDALEGRYTGTGWAILDGNASWCQREYDTTLDMKKDGVDRHHGNYQYRTTKGGFPLLERAFDHLIWSKGEEKRLDLETVTEFSAEAKEVPETAFLLSAFGLPEPEELKQSSGPFVGASRTLLWVWILIGAGVCLVLAVVCRALARRYAVV